MPVELCRSPPSRSLSVCRLSAICDNCVMVNGVGYKAHWASCDLFIQCQFLPDGSVTVRIKQCPHGLHWDQKALTCTRPSQAKCPFGKYVLYIGPLAAVRNSHKNSVFTTMCLCDVFLALIN